MRILYFIESLAAGGKERRVVELLKGLTQHKDITIELVLTRNEIHYQEIFGLGIPIHIIKRKFLKKDPRLFFSFFRIAKKFKPDIIHVWGHMVAVYAVPAKWILNVPLLNNEITDATINKKLIAKSLVFKASDKIIANTKAGLISYQAPLAKSGVIYNGFNFQRIAELQDPEVVRNRFNITTIHVIAMVASFNEHKDWDTYLQAAILLTKKRNDVTFLCIGSGDDSQFRKMISESHAERIHFLGRQRDVESIMNICSVGVLTTKVENHGEGISNALMEFMALSKAVIATNFGGSAELIEPNVSGYLIDPNDHAQLTEKIEYLIDHHEERSRIEQAAHARIKEYFSIDRMIANFYSEYHTLYNKAD